MKKILILLALAALIMAVAYYVSPRTGKEEAGTDKVANRDQVIIGFIMGESRVTRWFRDRDFFVERAEELGTTVSVMDSNNIVAKQIEQINTLVLQGARTIVIVPIDASALKESIEKARLAGVKVIAYDRLIKDTDIDYYVSFDNVEVGRMQAQGVVDAAVGKKIAYIGGSDTDNNAHLLKEGSMKVLQPLIDSGEVELAVDVFTEGWNPDLAFKAIDEYLAAGGTLDGVIAANDGNAGAVIQALKKYNLAGKIPVSGQDAELSACQRVVNGTQTITVYKPLKTLAYQAAEAAVALAVGQVPEVNSSVNNGSSDIASYLITPTEVNRDNIDSTVIADGFYTREQVYSAQ